MKASAIVWACAATSIAVCNAAFGQTATLDWMEEVYADGAHNAFTDLIRWKDRYYLCFRHGTSHGSMDGEIRVLASGDMRAWDPCATFDTMGDDRDPHFTATDDRLYVYFGVWDSAHGSGHALPDRHAVRSHFASSEDGRTWSKVQAVYEPGWWLWRVRRLGGAFYGAAYTAIRPKPDSRETRLLRSDDGLEWMLVSTVTTERLSGEADFWFDADGTMQLLTRTGDAAGDAMLLRSDTALATWTRQDMGVLVHSPVVVHWKDRCFISGRGRDGKGYNTTIWELRDGKLLELLVLPSGGDTGYSGLIVDPATEDAEAPALFASWYSQHENEGKSNAASIYVVRVGIVPAF